MVGRPGFVTAIAFARQPLQWLLRCSCSSLARQPWPHAHVWHSVPLQNMWRAVHTYSLSALLVSVRSVCAVHCVLLLLLLSCICCVAVLSGSVPCLVQCMDQELHALLLLSQIVCVVLCGVLLGGYLFCSHVLWACPYAYDVTTTMCAAFIADKERTDSAVCMCT